VPGPIGDGLCVVEIALVPDKVSDDYARSIFRAMIAVTVYRRRGPDLETV
jgi:hypothetical protein